MKKIFIDSNIWLRLFTNDPSPQFEACRELITRVEAGKFLPYTSNIVLLEVAFTLKTFYALKHQQIITYLNTVLNTRNLTVIEKTDSVEALKLYRKTRIKFTDCLIATQVKPDLMLVSFDRDFIKLIPKQTKTPSDFFQPH